LVSGTTRVTLEVTDRWLWSTPMSTIITSFNEGLSRDSTDSSTLWTLANRGTVSTRGQEPLGEQPLLPHRRAGSVLPVEGRGSHAESVEGAGTGRELASVVMLADDSDQGQVMRMQGGAARYGSRHIEISCPRGERAKIR
jgi:hypothetical protein